MGTWYFLSLQTGKLRLENSCWPRAYNNRKTGYKIKQSRFQIYVFTISTLASKTSAYFSIHLEHG